MLGRNTILAVSCALQASAFLLPPGVTVVTEDSSSLFVDYGAKTQLVELPCTGCSVNVARPQSANGRFALSWNRESVKQSDVNVLLNFTISEDAKALLLNDEQIWPMSFDIKDMLKPEWSVEQVAGHVEQKDLESGDYKSKSAQITGYVLNEAQPKHGARQDPGVISLLWQLLSLDHKMVEVDEIMIQMIQTPEGELMLMSAQKSPDSVMSEILFPSPGLTPVADTWEGSRKPSTGGNPWAVGKPGHLLDMPNPFAAGEHGHVLDMPNPFAGKPHKNCKNLPAVVCDFVHAFDSKISAMHLGKPHCSGRPTGWGSSANGHLPTHIRPQFGSHRPMPPHHHAHSTFHRVSHAILSVLLPAIAGILVGVVVSVLGLMTGRFIAYLWYVVIRGGKKGSYSRVAADDIIIVVTDADADKKEGFVVEAEHDEHLPLYEAYEVYEDAPAYEETEKEAL